MRITAFWAKGYRSLADVHLDKLGPISVFYGRNGTGKSNILAGMQTLFGLLAWRSAPDRHDRTFAHCWVPYEGSTAVLHPRDRCSVQQDETMILGARVAATERDTRVSDQWPAGKELVCEAHYDWFRRDLRVPILVWAEPGETADALAPDAEISSSHAEQIKPWESLVHRVAKHVYARIEANGMPRAETRTSENDVAAILAAGTLKEGLLRANAHPSPVVRQRFKELQELLAGPPLH